MNNIEYYGIPYHDDEEVRNYRLQQRRKAKRLAKKFAQNEEVLLLAEEYEELEQRKALAAYQRKRAQRKCNSDRDAELYHLNSGCCS